jgi:hypothetical protein
VSEVHRAIDWGVSWVKKRPLARWSAAGLFCDRSFRLSGPKRSSRRSIIRVQSPRLKLFNSLRICVRSQFRE